MMTVANFRAALADFIESPEGKAEIQPFVHQALDGVPPLARIALTLFIDAVLAITVAKLRVPVTDSVTAATTAQ